MAYTDYILRFRTKSTEWLLQRQEDLEAQETIFSQQSMGNTSMSRDLRMLQEQLTAIAYVLKERGAVDSYEPTNNPSVGITDFSQIDGSGSI